MAIPPTIKIVGILAIRFMKPKNRKLFIVIILVLIVFTLNYKPEPQMVAPECFEKEDCIVSIKEKYCGVRYDCVVGKCYHEDIPCPEICRGNKDEDLDGKIDCDDPDCFSSELCMCEKMTFLKCYEGRCYCEVGTTPMWFTYPGGHECRCT